MTSRTLPLLAAAALAIALSACAPTATGADPSASGSAASPSASSETECTPETGVTVIVDGGGLASADDIALETCVPADGPVLASDVLADAGVALEGTDEYGDAIVCRVDGQPSADAPLGSAEDPDYIETCESMPAAFGYWGMWVKNGVDGEWGFAQEGIETLEVAPGDSFELLFSLDGEPAAPTP